MATSCSPLWPECAFLGARVPPAGLVLLLPGYTLFWKASTRAPYQRTAHPPPGSGLPPAQPRFHPGGRGTRRANGRAERGSGGGLCSRPARGTSSANGRAPHIPGSGAPPLAASVPAGLARGHARAARRLEAAPGGKAGKMRRSGSEGPRVAIVACSSTVYVRPSARLGEAGSGR